MNFSTAQKIHETFTLDKDFNPILVGTNKKLEDPMCKGYIYANLYFYDEVQKEIEKLRAMIKKIHEEVVLELGIDPDEDPSKLLLEISVRVRRAIGDDSLDAIIKEHLAQKARHITLMVDKKEAAKLAQICEAIFLELTAAFFNMTLASPRELENNVCVFKLSKEYIDKLTDRQKRLLSPALRVLGFEHQIKLNNFELAQDWTVRYTPEKIPTNFTKQEETIKDQIKVFVQTNS